MNEKIKCLAIDDEPLALKQLATYIGKIPFLELAGACLCATEAKAILDEDTVDAMFCDINMPDMNGMDFVKSLAAPPLVIFTTAYADYAIEGYKVDAVDYLLKPFGLDDFRRAANKLQQRLARPYAQVQEFEADDNTPTPKDAATTPDTTATPLRHDSSKIAGIASDYNPSLFVKTEGRMVKINVDDICYVEGMSEYLKIHFDGMGSDGKPQKPIVILFSMKSLEERLPRRFMRIHRSYMVNLEKIQEVNKNRVIMKPDVYLPIGDLYKDALNTYVGQNFLGK